MKKNYLFLASAAILMAGCSANDDLVPGATSLESTTGQAINFNMKKAAMTRGTESGADAAKTLNGEFIVYGTKGTGTASQIAFKNYVVKHDLDNTTTYTAGTTNTNTSGWEYVGINPYANTKVSPKADNQTVKYWDYSQNSYQFTAISANEMLNTKDVDGTTDKPLVKVNQTSVTSGSEDVTSTGYTVNVPASASLNDIFFSDKVTVNKANYNQPVVLTFRNFGAKVRVGFYETIPGYKVTINRFYYDKDASKPVEKYADMTDKNDANDKNFYAAVQNVNAATTATGGNQITVTYADDKAGNANQPIISTTGSTYQYTLTLGEGLIGETLGTSADGATYAKTATDGNANNYTTVYPNLQNNKPMLIRCDYTLTSEDGSKEEIKVYNARVIVPAEYVQWKSNYAYTYLFKISDKSNGTTGKDPGTGGGSGNPDNPDQTDSPEGLFPITFDAVVVSTDEYQQETITTVASNSVTSYAKIANGVTKDKYEYKVGDEVYFVDTKTGDDKSVINPSETLGETAGSAQIYKLSWTNKNTEAPTEADVIGSLTGLNNGLKKEAVSGAEHSATIPSADGTNITMNSVKFTVPSLAEGAKAEYYAYVYCTTAYKAQEYTAVTEKTEAKYDAKTTYYYKTDAGYYYAASGITAANFDSYKSKLYVEDTTDGKKGVAGVYDVKVIKVVAAQ